MKKLLVAFFIILAFAGAAFYFGWTSFAVPVGAYGVLATKTGGVDPEVAENGRFSWNWERLLPTNSRLSIFSLAPRTIPVSSGGTLPSGDLYASVVEGKPDFSWKITGSVSVTIDPSRLPALVRDSGIADQAALDAWTDGRIAALVDSSVRNALSLAVAGEMSGNGGLVDPAAFASRVAKEARESSMGDFASVDVRIDSLSFPDTDLYRLAKRTYSAYLEEKSRQFATAAAEQAGNAAADRYTLDTFEKWGELLTKYPVLIDFLAISKGNAEEALKMIKELR